MSKPSSIACRHASIILGSANWTTSFPIRTTTAASRPSAPRFAGRRHGQIRHREEPEPEAEADNEPAMTITRAWQTALDFLDLDLDALDIGEVLEQMYQIKRAMKALFVTNEQRERVRAKYRAVRAMT
jgi:hypothetical protein